MKLGLLVVVLAVAVLVPSLSEGRTISKCEMRARLKSGLKLPYYLLRQREKVMAVVTCETIRRSRLNTALVNVHGKRIYTTTTAEPTTVPSTTPPPTTQPPTTTPTTTPIPTTTPTSPPTTTTTTPPPTYSPPTTTTLLPTAPITVSNTTNQTTAVPQADMSWMEAEEELSDQGNSEDDEEEIEGGGKRQKRAIAGLIAKKLIVGSLFKPRAVVSGLLKSKARSPWSYARYAVKKPIRTPFLKPVRKPITPVRKPVTPVRKPVTPVKKPTTPSRGSRGGSRGGSTGGSSVGVRPPSSANSLGLYGIFQLSDREYCDSGYVQTKNKCNKDCGDFTDDDIRDDIDCIVKSGHWWDLWNKASSQCRYPAYNYFRGCPSSSWYYY